MESTAAPARSSITPVLGAALVVAAVGGLVWSLTRLQKSPSLAPAAVGEIRGAPIRSAASESRGTAPAGTAERTGVSAPAAGSAEPAPKVQDGYEEIRFAQLSGFDYPKSGSMQVARMPAENGANTAPPPDAPPSKIPPEVRALDQRQVSITGFMNPIEFDKEGVKSFALTAIPGGCCYGAIPRLNEWIVVTMKEGELAEYAYYDPVTIFGALSVGEIYDEGVVLSLYRMTPEKVDVGY